MNENIQIFVVTHKGSKSFLPEGYSYISVNPSNEGFEYYDNCKENIHSKNKEYCELTALYWIWKNTTFNEIGLCHYRRFFVQKMANQYLIAPANYLDSLLADNDIVLPEKLSFSITNKQQYFCNHFYRDLKLCLDQICKDDESYKPYVKRFLNSKSMYTFNMFFSRRSLIEKYCKWLFSLFSSIENQIDVTAYSDYQKRVFGFLSERLFNIWIMHEQLKIAELLVVQEDPINFPLDFDKAVPLEKVTFGNYLKQRCLILRRIVKDVFGIKR